MDAHVLFMTAFIVFTAALRVLTDWWEDDSAVKSINNGTKTGMKTTPVLYI